jgi:hypothetical protein
MIEKHKGCRMLVKVLGDGPINPKAWEWMMGWPIGWTDLKPLATDKCRSKWLSHGRSLVAECADFWGKGDVANPI